MATFQKRLTVEYSRDVTVEVDAGSGVIDLEILDDNRRLSSLWPSEAKKLRKALKKAIRVAEANL